MKTKVKFLMLIGLIFTAKLTNAAESNNAKPLEVSVYKIQNSLKLRLNIEKPSKSMVQVSVFNANDEMMMSEKIIDSHEKLSMNLDMEQLPQGTYTIHVNDGHKSIMQTIEIKSETVKTVSIK